MRGHRPVVGGSLPARHNDDSQNPGTTALEIHLAAAADVDEVDEIRRRRRSRDRAGGEQKRKEQGTVTGHDQSPRGRHLEMVRPATGSDKRS